MVTGNSGCLYEIDLHVLQKVEERTTMDGRAEERKIRMQKRRKTLFKGEIRHLAEEDMRRRARMEDKIKTMLKEVEENLDSSLQQVRSRSMDALPQHVGGEAIKEKISEIMREMDKVSDIQFMLLFKKHDSMDFDGPNMSEWIPDSSEHSSHRPERRFSVRSSIRSSGEDSGMGSEYSLLHILDRPSHWLYRKPPSAPSTLPPPTLACTPILRNHGTLHNPSPGANRLSSQRSNQFRSDTEFSPC
ncbi:hypothetical protein AAFF_G00372570 [Aldrovandia affinis]|uniref:Uncharacterized protein n=1 Tax=Aldrovandia affinis TaxID=143900 RepID=A0AAD7SGT3_9TELE|nr:hypothetical protein AAFF_G00372570 [Aldrovandia affinis]